MRLRVEAAAALHKKLKRLGARGVEGGRGRGHEMNVIFDTTQGGLAKHGQLLRIRMETPEVRATKNKGRASRRVMLTFKRPAMSLEAAPSMEGRVAAAGRHKVREEIEVEVSDAENLTKIFEGLGMRGWFRYEKYRTTFKLPAALRWAQSLLIELDQTPVGTFMDMERPAEPIHLAAQEMCYRQREYVLKHYLALYGQECRCRCQ